MSCFFKILDDGQSPRKNCHLTLVMLCSLFWISCHLKTGPKGCPEMSVSNYHSMLCDTAQERRSHMMVWQCKLWFGSARSGSEWSSSELCTWI